MAFVNESLRLSKALSDIGVNQWVVSKVRRNALLYESMHNMTINLEDCRSFIFGSWTEVSYTPVYEPDIDFLAVNEKVKVIQDIRDWRRGEIQFLMVQNEFTSPGYCLLKFLKQDVPESFTSFPFLHHFGLFFANKDIHGPASFVKPTRYIWGCDMTFALKCQSWPHEAEPWLELHSQGGWPNDDTKRYAKDNGCFLVPVSSKTSVYPGFEWRISTSLAERYLMFSLNITQLRCYILLKTISRLYLKPWVGDVISSFMCKCILLNCISQSKFQDWQEHNLVTCLVKCLRVLLQNIQTEICPHFIFTGNNLLAGKLIAGQKNRLENILTFFIKNVELTIQRICVDRLDFRRYVKSGDISELQKQLVGLSTTSGAVSLVGSFIRRCQLPKNILLKQVLNRMMQTFLNGKAMDQMAFRIFCPFLCTLIGTTLASDDIQHFRALSPEVRDWFTLGLFSDVASSKLKFASVLYCAGKFKRCKNVLKGVCRMLASSTVFCWCLCPVKGEDDLEFRHYLFYDKDELQFLRDHVAACVRFSRYERHCVPEELQYERFQSTTYIWKGEISIKTIIEVAAVDSLPYLYFLQYKVYQKLCKRTEQLSALTNLMQTIENKPALGHKETALNLLGKCMEQENRKDLALAYYVKSLTIRQKNNAANWHIILLLFSIYRKSEGFEQYKLELQIKNAENAFF